MQWEFELSKYERDNNAQLPEPVKIAVLLNETTGPLQQHLQLLASSIKRYSQARNIIMEYYRATTAFSKMERQQQAQSSAVATSFGGEHAPMDVGAIGKGKGKHKGKGKGKYKGKGNNNYGYNGYGFNKGKGKQQGKGYIKAKGGKGYGSHGNGTNKGKSKGIKGAKGKDATNICYKCGRPLCKSLQGCNLQPWSRRSSRTSITVRCNTAMVPRWTADIRSAMVDKRHQPTAAIGTTTTSSYTAKRNNDTYDRRHGRQEHSTSKQWRQHKRQSTQPQTAITST